MKLKTLLVSAVALLCSAGVWAQTDYTSSMSNDVADWTGVSGAQVETGVYGEGVETYRGNKTAFSSGDVLYQTINSLPNGYYVVSFYAWENYANHETASIATGNGIAQVFANSSTEGLYVIKNTGGRNFDSKNKYTLLAQVTNGTLKYGVKNTAAGGNWAVCKAISLTYIGATLGKNTDLTSALANPDFENAYEEDKDNIYYAGWIDDTNSEHKFVIHNKKDYPFSQVNGDYYVERYWWDNTSDLNQTTQELPAGFYRITATAQDDAGTPTFNLYAKAGSNDEKKQSIGTAADYSLEVYQASSGTIKLGFKGSHTHAQWAVVDNFRLTFLGDPKAELTTLQATIDASYLNNATYTNVGGSERSALSSAKTLTAASETAADYETAISTVQAAIDAFVAAKSEYDRYAAEKANADRISSTIAAGISAPTTAAGCDAVINSILVAEYYYVSNSSNFNSKQAESYDLAIENWTFTGTYNNGTADSRSSKDTEHWSGTTKTYYEQGTNSWGSTNWVTKYSKTVTLPAGSYVLRVAARASTGTTATMKVTIGETAYIEALPNKGASTKGITTSGVASFSDGTFANTAGRGWQWRYLAFSLADEASVKFDIDAASPGNHEWCSFCDVELYSNVDISGIESALSSFEASNSSQLNDLGFEKDQYAPYNNVTVLEAYATATAINDGTQVPSTQESVNSVISTLGSPSWTANAADVDAIYNNDFSDGDWYPTAWSLGNSGWAKKVDDINASNTISETGKGWRPNPGTVLYGTTGVYTMPLAANTDYKLTFKYGSWNDSGWTVPTVSVLNGSDEGLAETSLSGVANSYQNAMISQTMFFKTGAAGNYVLSMAGSANIVWTDVSLVKATASEVTLSSGRPAAHTFYQTLTLDRTFSAENWNTLCVPYAFNASDFAKVKELSSITVNGDNITMTLSDVDGTTTAGKPYLVKAENNGDGLTFSNVSTSGATVQESSATADGYTVNYVGTYSGTSLNGEDNANAYVVSSSKLYNVTSDVTVGAYRAYFTVTAPTPVKALSFYFDNETLIRSIDNGQLTIGSEIYNLAGQRMTKAQKGVNIINGKKVLVK